MLVPTAFLLSALSTLTCADQRVLSTRGSNGPLPPELDGLIEQLLEMYHVPAISIAVIDNGKLSSKGYGISNFPSTEATSDTLYFTGSTTKAFTATAAGLLVKDNDNYPNLTWSSRLHDFLPKDFILSSPYETTHTTLEDALSHRSGLPRHDLSYGWGNATLQSTVRSLRHLPLTAEPRTRFQYNNLMFGTVGYLIENLISTTLADFLNENIYKPLDMVSTFFTLPSVQYFLSTNPDRHLARGYFYHPDGYYIPEPYIGISNVAGAGATMSSVNDYAKWICAWLSAASSLKSGSKSTSPITTDLLASLQTPRSFVSGLIPSSPSDSLPFLSPITYALGWLGAASHTLGLPGPSRRLSFHGGGLPGFGTELYMLLDEGWGIVTMGNTAGTSNLVGSVVFYVLYKQRFSNTKNEKMDVNSLIDEVKEWLQKTKKVREVYGIGTTGKAALEPGTLETKQLKIHRSTDSSTSQARLAAASGVYSHPAYGNVTLIAESGHDSVFRVLPSVRTLPWDVLLVREDDSDTNFPPVFYTAIIRFGSGATRHDPIDGFDPSCDGELCRFDTFWQQVDQGLAYVEADGSFDGSVQRLGIELDGEMALVARRDKSPDGWRKGMIWFDRVR